MKFSKLFDMILNEDGEIGVASDVFGTDQSLETTENDSRNVGTLGYTVKRTPLKKKKFKRTHKAKVNESINDKIKFKAFFLMGGPGAGKSFISNIMFPESVKTISSDYVFEYILKQLELPMKIGVQTGTDKDGNPIYLHSDKVYKDQMDAREWGKDSTDKVAYNYINGMLPIIIDGTGGKYDELKKKKSQLESMGYDTYGIIVKVDTALAQKRNAERERSISDKAVVDIHKNVNSHIDNGAYIELFGEDNIIVIDNSNKMTPDRQKEISSIGYKWLNSPVKNPKSEEITDKLAKSGGKYLSDLGLIKKNLNFLTHKK